MVGNSAERATCSYQCMGEVLPSVLYWCVSMCLNIWPAYRYGWHSCVNICHLCIIQYITTHINSGISNSGHSKVRAASFQRTQLEVSKYFLPIVAIHFEPLKEYYLLTKDKQAAPKVPFSRRFHCN
jgi:hypothetical protein